MRRFIFLSTCLIGIAFMFSSCKKDDMGDADNSQVTYDGAYVMNGGSNSISVINRERNMDFINKIIQFICEHPFISLYILIGLMIISSILYVCFEIIYNDDDQKVEVTIDLANLTNNMGSGMMNVNMENMWPHNICLSPDKSKLAIALPGMDFSDGHNIMPTTISSGSITDGHSQHPNSSVVSNMQMQGKILVINAVTGELLKEITLEGIARNAAFSPDGKELWTALMMTEGKVNVFDANTYQLVSTIPVGDMPAEVTFSNDGSKAFLTNGMSNTVTVIDAGTKLVLDTIQVGVDPVGAWPVMDGMMHMDNEDDQSIHIINSMNMMIMDTVHLGFMPGMATQNNMMN